MRLTRPLFAALLIGCWFGILIDDVHAQPLQVKRQRQRDKANRVKVPYKIAVIPSTMANDEIEPIFTELGNAGWEFQREIPRGNDLILVFSKAAKSPMPTPGFEPAPATNNGRSPLPATSVPSRPQQSPALPNFIPTVHERQTNHFSTSSDAEPIAPVVIAADQPELLEHPTPLPVPPKLRPKTTPPRIELPVMPPLNGSQMVKIQGKEPVTITVIKLKHAPAMQVSEMLMSFFANDLESPIMAAAWNNAIVFRANKETTAMITVLVSELDSKFEGEQNPSELEPMRPGFGGLGGG